MGREQLGARSSKLYPLPPWGRSEAQRDPTMDDLENRHTGWRESSSEACHFVC
jgi:hypothetical protein